MSRHSSAFRLLLSAFFIFYLSSFIFACTPASPTLVALSSESTLFVFDFSTSSLLEYDSNFDIASEIPLNLPCPLTATHAAPRGPFLALELQCVNGPLVQIVDVDSGKIQTPFAEVDSHFLAWDFDGNLYLRVDALGNARVVKFDLLKNAETILDTPAQTYDLAPRPDGDGFAYSYSYGIGHGSAMKFPHTKNTLGFLFLEPNHIISLASWSPNGKMIAYIRFPDSSTPFPAGELWVVDFSTPLTSENYKLDRSWLLAPADAGRGYAPAWSPDSTRIAFVGRDNPEDPAADQSAGALVSNIYTVEIASGQVTPVTRFDGTLVESPVWSANGHFLAFSVVSVNDTINVWIADLVSGAVTLLESRGPACCPVWIRK